MSWEKTRTVTVPITFTFNEPVQTETGHKMCAYFGMASCDVLDDDGTNIGMIASCGGNLYTYLHNEEVIAKGTMAEIRAEDYWNALQLAKEAYTHELASD